MRTFLNATIIGEESLDEHHLAGRDAIYQAILLLETSIFNKIL